MAKIVVALGGNALGNSADEQLSRAQLAAKSIVDLIIQGHKVVIAHGNGPQVGQIRLAFENSGEEVMPLAECIAMSQGYIGYHLQQAIDEELVSRGIENVPVISMLTQVVVDADDPAFQQPTKPIGGYYKEEAAKKLMRETGAPYQEDAGRGWHRVVPSPKPIDIYEKISLQTLVDAGQVVIACGGGGIPVVYRGARYQGVDAVIDKDFAAAKMATLIEADVFVILTAVDYVYVDFGKENQRALKEVSLTDMQQYIAEKQFPAGSMLPKVEAACEFVRSGKEKTAIIANLEQVAQAITAETGTIIRS
ncbi:carbamate kinase [Enterococcus hulanensis]|uniref:Carbamate kinase n=1 Tax=Enterococcus hulanensis TaxID=2559929 RepID=A0ABU3EU26_9ENTE|nr:carbamate kinase [Enterococcus hulanensis]MDT2598369.1 carbamate kinase [Enterococcus hulanensis]MDT2608126.1 carbamate kinase [Enterococcus hulanensis]MDT2615421.1 carbamate kinase [Enterococcus hulanensis]MDT2626608.1 carbamate kinase [Enterococcus hulanensis]MDT2654493.1 carbamate kinase [Enterococcus hulanensis]